MSRCELLIVVIKGWQIGGTSTFYPKSTDKQGIRKTVIESLYHGFLFAIRGWFSLAAYHCKFLEFGFFTISVTLLANLKTCNLLILPENKLSSVEHFLDNKVYRKQYSLQLKVCLKEKHFFTFI